MKTVWLKVWRRIQLKCKFEINKGLVYKTMFFQTLSPHSKYKKKAVERIGSKENISVFAAHTAGRQRTAEKKSERQEIYHLPIKLFLYYLHWSAVFKLVFFLPTCIICFCVSVQCSIRFHTRSFSLLPLLSFHIIIVCYFPREDVTFSIDWFFIVCMLIFRYSANILGLASVRRYSYYNAVRLWAEHQNVECIGRNRNIAKPTRVWI